MGWVWGRVGGKNDWVDGKDNWVGGRDDWVDGKDDRVDGRDETETDWELRVVTGDEITDDEIGLERRSGDWDLGELGDDIDEGVPEVDSEGVELLVIN